MRLGCLQLVRALTDPWHAPHVEQAQLGGARWQPRLLQVLVAKTIRQIPVVPACQDKGLQFNTQQMWGVFQWVPMRRQPRIVHTQPDPHTAR